MNRARLEHLLSESLANALPAFPDIDDRKTCVARVAFDLEGKSYLLGDFLELDARTAKKLSHEGNVEVVRGGRADKLSMGKYHAVGFRPWDEPNGRQKGDYDEVLLPVKLLKPNRQIIIGLLELPREFYFPWKWIQSLSYCYGDDPGAAGSAVFEILEEPLGAS